jgi:hypothetical protein
VAGIIVTCDSDGAERIIGNLANFFSALGFTLQAFGTLTILWPGLGKKSDKSTEEIMKSFEENYTTTAKKAAQNLTFVADSLRIIYSQVNKKNS